MSGQERRAQSGTLSKSDTWLVTERPFAGALPMAGAFTSVTAFPLGPFELESMATPLLNLSGYA